MTRALPNPWALAASVALCVPLAAARDGAAGGPRTPAVEASVFATASSAHPTDGPDVDVQIRLDESAVTWRVDANLAFVDEVAEVPRELEASLAPVEERGAALALFETLVAENSVVVDGVELDPVLESWKVLPATLELIPLFPIGGAKSLIRVRVEYAYPLLAPPTEVAMTWGPFPVDPVIPVGDGEPPARVVVIAALNAGGLAQEVTFTEAEPGYTWHGELPSEDELFLPVPSSPGERRAPFPVLPFLCGPLAVVAGALAMRADRRVLALVLIAGFGGLGFVGRHWWLVELPVGGAPALSDEEALAVFEPLHQNIYRAFGFDDEERVYDALARSVDGDLLDTLYRQVYRGLVMEEEGGAVSRVQAVRRLDADVEQQGRLEGDRFGFTVRTRWEIDGSVLHFGHRHRRTQEYEARYVVARPEGASDGWRIVGSEVLSQIVTARSGEEPVTPSSGSTEVGSRPQEL